MKQIRKLSAQAGLAAILLSATFGAGAASAQATASSPNQVCTSPSGQQPDIDNLSGKLDECNSVLEPPKVGDAEIVAPTPQTGTMPVVKPGELPKGKNP
jgi:NaMN:DMB phosphoribosyltransferase